MQDLTGAGFFGKLPGTGDFVQRRLPSAFVDAWDHHFEQVVDAARQRIGECWAEVFPHGPVWCFVLPPGVCGAAAWVGAMGPSRDRVGRRFPLVIAASVVDPVPMLRDGGTWFDAASALLSAAQGDAGISVESFDARVTALDTHATVTVPGLDAVDGRAGTHWYLPLPVQAVPSALVEAWQRAELAGADGCLWWTKGADRVPASMMLMRGLPSPDAYVAMLAHVHSVVCSGHGSAPKHSGVAPAKTQPIELFADVVSTRSTQTQDGCVGVVQRGDLSLVMVAASSTPHDPRHRAVAAACAAADALTVETLGEGLQGLHAQLTTLHSRLQVPGEQADALHEDVSVLAVRITHRWAALLRTGTAAAWHWRDGELTSLFATSTDSLAGGDVLDDLLFTRATTEAPGLGGAGALLCDEVVCAVAPGDRLLLLATPALVGLSPDIHARALAMPTCDEARARIAVAAGLGADPAPWPLAVIGIKS